MSWHCTSDLPAYRKEHPGITWKQTGRLARWGVPASDGYSAPEAEAEFAFFVALMQPIVALLLLADCSS